MKNNNSKAIRNSEGINLPFISSKNKGGIQNQVEAKKDQTEFNTFGNNYNKKINNPDISGNFSRNMMRNGRRDSYSLRNDTENVSAESNQRSYRNYAILECERNQVNIPNITHSNSKYKQYSYSNRNNNDYYKQANMYKQQHVGLRRDFSERRALSENSPRYDNSRDNEVHSLDRKPTKNGQFQLNLDSVKRNASNFGAGHGTPDILASDRSWGSQNSYYYNIKNNIKAPPINNSTKRTLSETNQAILRKNSESDNNNDNQEICINKIPSIVQQNKNIDLKMINEQMFHEMNHDTDHENKSIQEEPKNAFGDEKFQLAKHYSDKNKVISENLKSTERDERLNAHKSFQHRREKFKKMDQKQRKADVNFNKGNVFNI